MDWVIQLGNLLIESLVEIEFSQERYEPFEHEVSQVRIPSYHWKLMYSSRISLIFQFLFLINGLPFPQTLPPLQYLRRVLRGRPSHFFARIDQLSLETDRAAATSQLKLLLEDVFKLVEGLDWMTEHSQRLIEKFLLKSVSFDE